MPPRLKKEDSRRRRVETHGVARQLGSAASVFGPPLDMEMSEAGLRYTYWLG